MAARGLAPRMTPSSFRVVRRRCRRRTRSTSSGATVSPAPAARRRGSRRRAAAGCRRERPARERAVRQTQDRLLLLGRGVAEGDLEQEAVELRLRQREDAALLVGVLGGDDHERHGQPVGAPVDRHVPLLHRLEQRGLRARRRAVDLVREQDVREHGAGREHRLAEPGDASPAISSGGRVGCELDAPEGDAEHARDGAGHERLRDAGRPLHQDVAARDGRDEQEIERLLVPDDHPVELGVSTVEEVGERVLHGSAQASTGPAPDRPPSG